MSNQGPSRKGFKKLIKKVMCVFMCNVRARMAIGEEFGVREALLEDEIFEAFTGYIGFPGRL